MNRDITLFTWESYNPLKGGFVFTYSSSMSAELPIRDILDEQGKGIMEDPNPETLTFGFFDCLNLKEREVFVDKQKKYAFFLTKYAGTNPDFQKKIVITGYMEVKKIKNMYGRIEKCFDKTTSHKMKGWWAFYGEMKLVSLEDSIELTPELLEKWGYDKKSVSKLKQMTIDLDETQANELVAHFVTKTDITANYVEEIESLNNLIF